MPDPNQGAPPQNVLGVSGSGTPMPSQQDLNNLAAAAGGRQGSDPSNMSPLSQQWQHQSNQGTSFSQGMAGAQRGVGDVNAPISYGQLASLYNDPNAAAEQQLIQQGMGMQMPSAMAGLTQLGAVSNANAAQINQQQSNNLLGGQLNYINQLNAQAHGQGPSLAEQQAKDQAQQNIAAQMAMMGSQRGSSNSALGLRSAQEQAAQANQQAVQAGVMGRTQEELGAQQALGQALQGTQGQVMQGAQAQAQLQQQANMQNAQAANQATLQQGQMNQQTTLANLQAQLQSGQIDINQYNAMLQAQLGVDQNQFAAGQNLGSLLTNENAQLQGIHAGVAVNSSNNAVGETGAVVGGVGSTVGGLLSATSSNGQSPSDRRLKSNIKPAARSIRSFLSEISAMQPSTGFALLGDP